MEIVILLMWLMIFGLVATLFFSVGAIIAIFTLWPAWVLAVMAVTSGALVATSVVLAQ